MKNLLFICTSNLDRSPAAESLFENSKKYHVKSCGIMPHAERVISKEAVMWADEILCMEPAHAEFIMENFEEARGKKIIVLRIPNTLCRNDPRLMQELKIKLKDYL